MITIVDKEHTQLDEQAVAQELALLAAALNEQSLIYTSIYTHKHSFATDQQPAGPFFAIMIFAIWG